MIDKEPKLSPEDKKKGHPDKFVWEPGDLRIIQKPQEPTK